MNRYRSMDYRKIIEKKHNNTICAQLTNLFSYSPSSIYWNKNFEIIVVVEGSVTVRLSQECFVLSGGDVIILHRDEVHILESETEETILLSVQLTQEFFEKECKALSNTHFIERVIFKDDKKAGYVAAFLFSILRISFSDETPNSDNFLRKSALVTLLLEYLSRNLEIYNLTPKEEEIETARIQRMNFIHSFVKTNYREKILLADLSEVLEITLSHLSHFVKDNFILNFRDYLAFIRFEHAVDLLVNENKSVNQAAFECGFSDVRYLTTLFRKYYNVNPQVYKNKALKPLKLFCKNSNIINYKGYFTNIPNDIYCDLIQKSYDNHVIYLLDFIRNEI